MRMLKIDQTWQDAYPHGWIGQERWLLPGFCRGRGSCSFSSMMYRDLGFRARPSSSSTISLIGRIAGRPRAPLPSNSTSASSPLGSQMPRSSAESGCSLGQQNQSVKVCLPMCELNTFRMGSLPPAVREECLPRGHRRGSSLPGNLILLLLRGDDLGGRRTQRHQSSRQTVSITRPGLHKLKLLGLFVQLR